MNVQGDEPLIDPLLINAVADCCGPAPHASMGTAAHAIDNAADLTNPNVVKVVLDAPATRCTLARSRFPYRRDRRPPCLAPQPLRHVGIYGYRVGFLRLFPTLPQAPSR